MSSENPVPTVGVVAFDNDNVLLVRSGKASSHVTGSYGLPAGRIEPGEDEVSAARRELQEETGLVAEKLVEFDNNTFEADVPRSDGSTVRMFWRVFLAPEYAGELTPTNETIPEWRPLSELDALPLQPNVKNAVENAVQYHQK